MNISLPPILPLLTTLSEYTHALPSPLQNQADHCPTKPTKDKTYHRELSRVLSQPLIDTKPTKPHTVPQKIKPPQRAAPTPLTTLKPRPHQQRPRPATKMSTPRGAAIKAECYAEAERLVQLHQAAEDFRPCPLLDDSQMPCPPDMDPEIWRVARNKMRLAERKKSIAALRAYEKEMAAIEEQSSAATRLSRSTLNNTGSGAASSSGTAIDEGSWKKRNGDDEKKERESKGECRGGWKGRVKRLYQALK